MVPSYKASKTSYNATKKYFKKQKDNEKNSALLLLVHAKNQQKPQEISKWMRPQFQNTHCETWKRSLLYLLNNSIFF